MAGYSKKVLEKRKKERAGYAEFFIKHIGKIKENNSCCAECGSKLRGDVSEIAHILPKGYFKSIATNDKNVIYLCGMYSNTQCHTNFDNYTEEKVKKMQIYPEIIRIFAELENLIQEKIPWKIYNKYTI